MSASGSMRSFLRSKIHRATVTQAELHYEGSLTMDSVLMREADILPGEEVRVWNVTRGTRFRTYAIEGQADSGVMCVNGAAAHLASAGDLIIVATFQWLTSNNLENYLPKVIFVDERNRVVGKRPEIPGPPC